MKFSFHRDEIIGAAGLVAQITVDQANHLVGLLVGLATLSYLVTRNYFLIKNQGEKKDET